MIALGYTDGDKRACIAVYCAEHAIRQTVVISANAFPLALEMEEVEHVPYSEVIMYRTFYPLLQKIDKDTLVVVNECLRNQNRYDLAYNCIRNFLNQTQHVLVFQQLPQIDTQEDFMILFDFGTQSRWKRLHFDAELIVANVEVDVRPLPLDFTRIDVPTSAGTQAKYEAEKIRLFSELGPGDPHTLPRNLYLLGGRDKAAWLEGQRTPGLFEGAAPINCVARNRRLNRPAITTYDEATAEGAPYTILEFPHAFADYCDFVRRTGQAQAGVLCADLKVDDWYFRRYVEWSERIHATYASLRR